MWEPQLALAAHGWRVIAPHLRGLRRRDAPIRRRRRWTTMPATSSTCSTRCTSTTRSSAACRWAATSRSRCCATRRATCGALVLADTRSQADTPEGVEARAQDAGAGARDKGPAAVADEMIPKLLGEYTRRDAAGASPTASATLDPVELGRGDRGRDTALMTRPDSTPLLRSIHCPTLIVVGEEDTMTPPALIGADAPARSPGRS